MFDENGDGHITKNELQKVFCGGNMQETDEELWAEMMKEVDRDEDARISYAEFSEAMTSVIKLRSSTLKRGEIWHKHTINWEDSIIWLAHFCGKSL